MASFVPTLHLNAYPAISSTRPEVSLAGKSVLVTGGGYGIGASIARSCAAAGARRIAISGRSKEKLLSTAAELHESYPQTEFSPYVGDITDLAAVAAMFDSFGPPDVLVNNAGFLPAPEDLQTVDLASWWKGFEVNVLGTATVIQQFIRVNPASKAAVVVNLSTSGAWQGKFSGLSSYGASKLAQLRTIELFQVESPHLRFVSLNPGAVQTDMFEKSGLAGAFPVTEAKLAADFVVWLASPEADFMAGRVATANWDVEERKAKKQEILDDDLLLVTVKGL